ncbi:TAXI family TRAP transporter solute-binding subunit [Natrialba sp. PRR66]|uniref:TAXI family TRAP transporter solute-binding subunit n=1 Tax=Natrialba sp. PRR66 TaxID=3098146 RepID=UPI002B1E7A74|nr:TAXI family TRAP transporter solute-binding subunit [Natrialba sp. PRR66]
MGYRNSTRRKTLTAIGATGAFGLAGCLDSLDELGGGSGDTIQMRTSTEDTAAYQLSQGIAAVADQQDEFTVDARPSDGALQSMRQLDNGTADIAYTDSLNAWQIANEIGEYEDNPLENEIQSVFWYYNIQGGLTARDRDTAESVTDLGGLSVNPNPVGTAMRTQMEAQLEHAIDLGDYDELALGYGEEGSALSEGTADIVSDIRINASLTPSYVEEQYSINNNAWLLTWPDEVVESIEGDDRPLTGEYISAEDAPGPDYGDRDEEYWTSTVYNTFVKADIGEDVVYDLLEMIVENLEEVSEYHALAEDWEDVEALAGPPSEIPDVEMHPGAQSFFNDQGVL